MAKGYVRFAAATAGAVLAVSMSACAGAPSTAATVGDTTITTTEVTKNARALSKLSQQQFPETAVLSFRVRGEAAKQVSTKLGQPLTDEMMLEALRQDQQLDQSVIADPDARPVFVDLMRAQVLERAMGATQFNQAVKTVPLKVNPRFGLNGYEPAYDLETGQVFVKSHSLSKLGSPVDVENFQ